MSTRLTRAESDLIEMRWRRTLRRRARRANRSRRYDDRLRTGYARLFQENLDAIAAVAVAHLPAGMLPEGYWVSVDTTPLRLTSTPETEETP